MSEAPGGAELLSLLGYVYTQSSKEYSSSFLGIPAFFARQRTRGHILKVTMSAIGSAAKMATMDNPEESPDAVAQQTLKTLWKTGKLEIEMTVRGICAVLFNQFEEQKNTKEMKLYVSAMRILGDIFKEVGAKATTEQAGAAFMAQQAQQPQQPQQPQQSQPKPSDPNGLD